MLQEAIELLTLAVGIGVIIMLSVYVVFQGTVYTLPQEYVCKAGYCYCPHLQVGEGMRESGLLKVTKAAFTLAEILKFIEWNPGKNAPPGF